MSYNKETGMYEGYIYKIYNDVNDKIYIGQTITTIENRFYHHIYDCFKRNRITKLYNAFIKYGKENFHIEEICKVSNANKNLIISELNELEIKYISKYNTVDNGYNILPGGLSISSAKHKVFMFNKDGIYLMEFDSSEDACEYLNIDKNKAQFINISIRRKSSCFGYYWDYTKETKIDFTKLKPSKRRIKQYDKNGVLLCTYESIRDAAKIFVNNDTNLHTVEAAISDVAYGKIKSKYGYIWRFESDEFVLSEKCKVKYKSGIGINCYTKDNKFLTNFPTLIDAYKSVNIEHSNSRISLCCKYKNKTAYGYKWFYANDPNQPDKTKIIA